ncbi:MAG: YigZ family protein [Neisseriaceae bacterium]|nr:YigZ family protein [Neisseriaceae bacterium]
MNTVRYRTIANPSFAEFKDKNSRFLAYAYPLVNVDEVKNLLQPLQKEHFKAVHYCYAYRLGADGSQFRANDDGEPSGSAGRPILGQIDSLSLTNTIVIVVRYFGGTLLGVPGLIRAYKTASSDALKNAQIIEKDVEKNILIICEYPNLHTVLNIVQHYDVRIVSQKLEMDCRITLAIAMSCFDKVISSLRNTRVVEIVEL